MKATELLRQAIRSKWRTDAAASRALDYSQAYIADVLNERRRISVSLAVRLEKALRATDCTDSGFARSLLTVQVEDDIASYLASEKEPT